MAGAAIWGSYKLFHHRTGAIVTIRIDGEVYKELPLAQDIELDIPGANGGTNHLVIKNSEATITEADCPDQLCRHQAAISHDGESLVCLPHKVIVKVSAEKTEDDIDAIAK